MYTYTPRIGPTRNSATSICTCASFSSKSHEVIHLFGLNQISHDSTVSNQTGSIVYGFMVSNTRFGHLDMHLRVERCLSHFLALSLSHSLTHSLSRSLVLSLSCSLTLSLCHSLALSLPHALTLSLSHSLTLSLCRSLTLLRSHSPTYPLAHSLTLSLSHSHSSPRTPIALCLSSQR